MTATQLAARVVRAADTPADGAAEQLTLGTHTGFEALEQAVLDLAPERFLARSTGACEEALFVVSGCGELRAGARRQSLTPECAAHLPSGCEYEVVACAEEPLRAVRVTIPDAEPPTPARWPSVCHLAARAPEAATTNRQFRSLAGPESGLLCATHFVGYIPTERAPEHYHTYDEVIYVLDGQGAFHAGELHEAVGPGSCIQLPAGTVHCLENTGSEPMRVVALFRPAGSPAAAFYPDGTPAYQASDPQ